MAANRLDPARLYLDIDGVIIADEPPFEEIAHIFWPKENYSPEVVHRLGHTGLELVLLTTRARTTRELRFSGLTDEINGLGNGRVPLWVGGYGELGDDIGWKVATLIADQRSSPAPFVWADDFITEEARRTVSEYLDVPQLIIAPDSKTGLNETELCQIEDFAGSLYQRSA
jgi:hypothetical protein